MSHNSPSDQRFTDSQRLPKWMKLRIPKGGANRYTNAVLKELKLETVCDHARCPNRMECYGARTATFLIMGPVCTRNCAFCNVTSGQPKPLDTDEPNRLAEAAERLGLEHVVITCVTRDDLSDGGADHFRQCIEAVRERTSASVEVLPSDFGGNGEAVDLVVDARPDVYNHNSETVPRLYREVRGPKPDYRWTLEMFRRLRDRDPKIKLKCGMMLGLGETDDEVLETIAELHEAGCSMLTLGQYLRPSLAQREVDRYVTPEQFDEFARLAKAIGYEQVASGPLVRSSYHARRMLSPEEA